MLSFLMALGVIFSDPSYYKVRAENYFYEGPLHIDSAGDEVIFGSDKNFLAIFTDLNSLDFDEEYVHCEFATETRGAYEYTIVKIKALKNTDDTPISFLVNSNQKYLLHVSIGAPVLKKVSISAPSTNILNEAGKKIQLTPIYEPDVEDIDGRELSWSITKGDNLANIDQNGLLTVNGNGTGEVVVRAASQKYPEIYGDITITILDRVPATGIIVSPTEVYLRPGKTQKLDVTLTPENTTDTIMWSSSDMNVATVDDKGVITGVSNGNAAITATINGHSATVNVTVNDTLKKVTAEFYYLTDTSILKIDKAWDGDALQFVNPSNSSVYSYIGGKTQYVQSNENPNINKIFGVKDGSGYEELKDGLLFEIKSDLTHSVGGATSQYIYMSDRAGAGTSTAYGSQDPNNAHENVNNVASLTDGKEITSLYLNDLKNPDANGDYTVKYIYYDKAQQVQNVTIKYYVIDAENIEHEIYSMPGGMNNNNFGITVPNFADLANASIDSDIEKLNSEPRKKLSGKRMELYVDGEQVKEFTTGVLTTFFATKTASSTFEGSDFELRVYYGQPLKPTNNIIQMPMTMYDFAADGMFFEFCSNTFSDMTKSYGYGMWNGGTYDGMGLVSETLMNDQNGKFGPRLQYTEETIAFIADLINNGVMWDGNNKSEAGGANDAEECPDIPKYTSKDLRALIENCKGTLGTYADVEAALADGEITVDEVTTSYVAAAYMMTHFFDEADNYGKKVPSNLINAIQLREMTDNETTYYVYDANWTSTVNNGVIQNTLNAEGELTDATAPLSNAFYLPLDWAGSDAKVKDEDQYDNADFLFTSVGQGDFIYNKEKELFFTFKGDDDVYLYINGKLAVDIGGAHAALEQSISLNDFADYFGLKDGEKATFTFFHMERHGTGSNFRMITNIEITDSSLLTDKKAYQNDTLQPNGSIVESNIPIEYEFVLTNNGGYNMFNLSFEDETLGIMLYPYGSGKECKVDGKGKDGVLLSNSINYGDIKVAVYQKDSNETIIVPKYQFDEQDISRPIVDENHNPVVVENQSYGSFGSYENGIITYVTIAEKYAELYGTENANEDNYKAFLQEILRNGIAPGNTIVLRGFNKTLDKNMVFTNRLNTYGTDYNMHGIPGTGSTKVKTISIDPVMFVIDFGKTVTYTEEQIFKTTSELHESVHRIVPNSGEPLLASDTRENATEINKTYGYGQFWKELEKIQDETTDEVKAEYRERFSYTLTRFMNGVDTFDFEVTPFEEDGETEIQEKTLTKHLYMIPATTVYYEDDFAEDGIYSYNDYAKWNTANSEAYNLDTGIKYYGDWTTVENKVPAPGGEQHNDEVADLNDLDVYGFDESYVNNVGLSNGSAKQVDYERNAEVGTGPKAAFKFTGTGFEIYSRTSADDGAVLVSVYKAKDGMFYNPFKNVFYDKDGATVSSGGAIRVIRSDNLYASGTIYQIPVVKVTDLPYGDYIVVMNPANAKVTGTGDTTIDDKLRTTFILDAIRIWNPLGEPGNVQDSIGNSAYHLDREANAIVTELRKILLDQNSYNAGTVTNGAVFIDSYKEENGTLKAEVGLYSVEGPKHEVYLKPQQAIGFKINNIDLDRVAKVELGMKIPNAVADQGITVRINDKQYDMEVKSSTDMYYEITDQVKDDLSSGKAILIANINDRSSETETNPTDLILSLTTLKITFTDGSVAENVQIFSDDATVEQAVQMFMTLNAPVEEEKPPVEEPSEDETEKNPIKQFFKSVKKTVKTIVNKIKDFFSRW